MDLFNVYLVPKFEQVWRLSGGGETFNSIWKESWGKNVLPSGKGVFVIYLKTLLKVIPFYFAKYHLVTSWHSYTLQFKV